MNPFGTDLTQRNEQIAKQYAYSYQELDKKVKEKHRICEPKPFAENPTPNYDTSTFAERAIC